MAAYALSTTASGRAPTQANDNTAPDPSLWAAVISTFSGMGERFAVLAWQARAKGMGAEEFLAQVQYACAARGLGL